MIYDVRSIFSMISTSIPLSPAAVPANPQLGPFSPARLRSSVQVQYSIPAEEEGSRSRGQSLYFVSLTPSRLPQSL